MARPRVGIAALALVVMAAAAYHNSFSVPFVFDDIVSIVENPAVRQPSVKSLLSLDAAGGLTTSGRPLVLLSLVANYAISGNSVWSYHVTNLAIHVCAGACLLGVVRRTLLSPMLREKFGDAALPVAWTSAMLWTLHPLQTESVTYIVQRAESLGGLFYLLTLYAFVRGTDTGCRERWWAVAVVACLMGVASKEVVVSAPLVVLLYDRTFVSGTLRAAWQRNRALYIMLGSTWIVLALLIIGTGGRGGTAGFGTEISSWAYALTQCRAILHYVWLIFWPQELIFDYGLATERHLFDVLPQAVAIAGLIVGVVIALRRWPVVGFIGACFLALLAPSSSVVPIATQTMAEHRLYLPLAPVLVGIAATTFLMLGWRSAWLLGIVAIALSVVTGMRNRDYRSEETIWTDTARKIPTNARAHNNLGQALFRLGKIPASIACYERALQLQPNYPETHFNLGVSLAHVGRVPSAIQHYQTAIRLQPRYAEAHNNLGVVLTADGRMQAALSHYQQAIQINPAFAEANHNFGDALLQMGQIADAEMRFRRALEIKPDYPEASYSLGNAFAAKGAMKDALASYQQALRLKPDYAEAHVNAGNALQALERPVEALTYYERAIAVNPRMADAHFNAGWVLMEVGRWKDAIPRLETALQLSSDFARARRALAFALARLGRISEAISHYELYIASAPDDLEAREELTKLRAEARAAR